MTEIAKLRALWEAATKDHPGAWSVDADWTYEILDGEGNLVAKFPLRPTSTPQCVVAAHNQMGRLLAVYEAAQAVFSATSAREHHNLMIALEKAIYEGAGDRP